MRFTKSSIKIILLSLSVFLTKTNLAQKARSAGLVVTISGAVKADQSGVNLAEASANIYNVSNSLLATAQTNSEGKFLISKVLSVTQLELLINCRGYLPYKKKITLQANGTHYNIGTIILFSDTSKLNKLITGVAPVNKKISEPNTGVIKGKVKDSIYRYVLSTATIAVYNRSDSSLLKFTIPDNLGEFTLQKLPLNTPLKLIITHVGYSPYKLLLKLDENKKLLDLNWIYMHQNSSKELEEIKITSYAPVRMNGDTIEFNPRAFEMGANSTAEDLMRRLPGMVIWGDGDITYNGKKINSLLVDGKPFMGSSDFTTATQNLPVDALDKVQIYSQRNEKNPLDSSLNANLKLKPDKKVGYFGKIGAGYGTNNRYAVDGMLNGYNKRFQIVTVGASNNINKSVNNINTLIRSNSYKGQGNNTDYQSDFKRPGVNINTTIGARLQYDQIPDATPQNTRRLITDYFFKRNNEKIENNRLMNTILKSDSILSNRTYKESSNVNATHNLSTTYQQLDKNYSLNVSAIAVRNQNDNTDKVDGEQMRTGTVGILSTTSSLSNETNLQNKLTFNSEFIYNKEINSDDNKKNRKNLLASFTIAYKFDYDENTNGEHNISSLSSNLNPGANKFFDRQYERLNSGIDHTVNVAYPNLKKLIFNHFDLGGINLEVGTTVAFSHKTANAKVFDINVQSFQYKINQYLTNNRDEDATDMQPRIIVSKMFYKGLTNRYSKRLEVFITPTLQYYTMQSAANQQSQNFKYQYSKFIPKASVNYNNHQYGSYEISGSLNFTSHVGYPTVANIAPLVDSANVYYIPKGNLRIKPEYTTTLTLQTSLESRKSKDPYKIELNLDGNLTQDKISDSTFYDNVGRRINYDINLNGNKYWHLGVSYRKSYSPNKNSTYRFNFWYNHFDYHTPQYTDALLITSNNRNNNFDLELAYSYLDIINVHAKQGISYYENFQNNTKNYDGFNNYTRFSGTLQMPVNLTWSSNINFNQSKARNQPTVNYIIWNASLTYRFLKGNRGEVSFAALDLLKQNKSIINNTNRNVQTFGLNNVLQQYFLIGLAYYPRKFGK